MSNSVFIDAGHGGKDSGAIGVNNVLEKSIALSVAQKVEAKLKKCGIETAMSRTSDVFISLDGRTDKANSLKSKCFVSIHCNSFNKQAKGIETYAYAEKYNRLASLVHAELIKTGCYTINRGVKYKDLHVLRESNMSACLVELGFIDNVEDVNLLLNKQDEFATAIAKGICAYLGVNYVEESKPNGVTGLWAVCVGAYAYNTAKEMQQELINKGYKDTYLIPR